MDEKIPDNLDNLLDNAENLNQSDVSFENEQANENYLTKEQIISFTLSISFSFIDTMVTGKSFCLIRYRIK